ncbi:hypothetical protein HID58_065866 [Brassica napus]|uniref:Uncharacterized protein n=1 Tax=Brassica napus TaxID=3708 RepID=A0ABQ7ZE21_BRANA|nr:hypothetical protein HID58_065866 [Brassica napus]
MGETVLYSGFLWDDGLHFRQPWAFCVQQEVERQRGEVKELAEEIAKLKRLITSTSLNTSLCLLRERTLVKTCLKVLNPHPKQETHQKTSFVYFIKNIKQSSHTPSNLCLLGKLLKRGQSPIQLVNLFVNCPHQFQRSFHQLHNISQLNRLLTRFYSIPSCSFTRFCLFLARNYILVVHVLKKDLIACIQTLLPTVHSYIRFINIVFIFQNVIQEPFFLWSSGGDDAVDILITLVLPQYYSCSTLVHRWIPILVCFLFSFSICLFFFRTCIHFVLSIWRFFFRIFMVLVRTLLLSIWFFLFFFRTLIPFISRSGFLIHFISRSSFLILFIYISGFLILFISRSGFLILFISRTLVQCRRSSFCNHIKRLRHLRRILRRVLSRLLRRDIRRLSHLHRDIRRLCHQFIRRLCRRFNSLHRPRFTLLRRRVLHIFSRAHLCKLHSRTLFLRWILLPLTPSRFDHHRNRKISPDSISDSHRIKLDFRN